MELVEFRTPEHAPSTRFNDPKEPDELNELNELSERRSVLTTDYGPRTGRLSAWPRLKDMSSVEHPPALSCDLLEEVGMLDHASCESADLRFVEVRGIRGILDRDVAGLYGVATRRLNRSVKGCRECFPGDFAMELTRKEAAGLRLRGAPLVYTERGVVMAAFVLDSRPAAEMSVFVVRALVRLRGIYATHIELTRRLDELDVKAGADSEAVRPIVEAVRRLMLPHSLPRVLVELSTLARWSRSGSTLLSDGSVDDVDE